MTELKLPLYLKYYDKVACMLPMPDGGAKTTTPNGYSFADFLEKGFRITEKEYQRLNSLDAARMKAKE